MKYNTIEFFFFIIFRCKEMNDFFTVMILSKKYLTGIFHSDNL